MANGHRIDYPTVIKLLTFVLLGWQWVRLESTYLVHNNLPNQKSKHIWDSWRHPHDPDSKTPGVGSGQNVLGLLPRFMSKWIGAKDSVPREPVFTTKSEAATTAELDQLHRYKSATVIGVNTSTNHSDSADTGEDFYKFEELFQFAERTEDTGSALDEELKAEEDMIDEGEEDDEIAEDEEDQQLGARRNRTAVNEKFALDPKKYDRKGKLRTTYVMHNLPKVARKCPHKRGEFPDLKGLPIQISQGHIDYTDLFVKLDNSQRLMSGIGKLTKRMLEATNSSKTHKYKTCAIVGNSGNLLGAQFGEAIDRHDVVMRLNQAPVSGYEEHVGKKTTFRLLNNAWLHRYCTSLQQAVLNKDISKVSLTQWPYDIRPVEPNMLPLERGTTFILTRYTGEEAEQIIRYWQKRKDINVAMLSSRVITLVRQMLQYYRKRLCDAGYGPYEGGTVPSSGLVGTYMLLQMCRSVTVYGFGRPGEAQGKLETKYHYYRMWGARTVGNMEAHSFDAELHLMRELMSNKRLYPPEGHVWYKRDVKQTGNLKICRPNEMGPWDEANRWCAAGGGEILKNRAGHTAR